MTRNALPKGTEGAAPQVVVGRQARIVVGGLSTIRRTFSLIEEQAEQLEKLDLVDESEMARLRELAAKATDLVTHYREGRFLNLLKSLIDRTDD
jgi:hypothetical protein